MDFPNAILPTLEPLKQSFVYDALEEQLRDMFCELFETYLDEDTFDANVLGVGHLGSLKLVRRLVNLDGLVFLPGNREEAAARYVYKAWRAKNLQGRGLAFIRTYLQMLLPNVSSVEQMMQLKSTPYPNDLYPRSLHENDTDKFLTSRVRIVLDVTQGIEDTSNLVPVISSVIPARLVPDIYLSVFAQSAVGLSAYFDCSITLIGDGAVLAPESIFGDSTYRIAAEGNIAITLIATSVVRR